jgi:hypothetical protein
MTLLSRRADLLRLPTVRSARRRGRRPPLTPNLEPLEDRLVLTSMLPSTNVVGPSVDQTLSNVVSNAALGGLTVASTAGFTQSPPNFLLLSQGQGGPSFALVTYNGISGSNFTTLALPVGDGTQVLTGDTIVSQAPKGATPAGAPQVLSATPFTFKMDGQPDDFAPSGYLYVQAAHGNVILNYKVEVDTADGNTTFYDCTIVGSFGKLQASPFGDAVNAGSFVVQAVAPAGGQTTSINPSPITVTAGSPFTLPVVSTAGFAPATPTSPGNMLVYYVNSSVAVVSYTGISSAPGGGSELTGCTTSTAGTIGAFGEAGSGPTANVQWTSAAPISFSFTNNSAEVPVYVAIAGQEINTLQNNSPTYGYLAPPTIDGQPDVSGTWQFMPFGSTTVVPTYTLLSVGSPPGATQTIQIPNDPEARLASVRIVFSIGSPPTIPVIAGQPSFPAAGNPSDPNNGINYDFVEFTERSSPNDGILFINTTQVDQVGLPFTMQTTPVDTVKSNGVGVMPSRPAMFSDYATYINDQFDSNSNFRAPAARGAFLGLATSNRLLNPSAAITNPPSPSSLESPFNNYFDAALTDFFNDYLAPNQTFRLQRDGYYFVGQTVEGFAPPPYSAPATIAANNLIIAPVGSGPTQMTFSVGETVTGPGITGTATITGVSVTPNDVTVLSLQSANPLTPASGSYTFTVPGTFTVLQLKQANSNWTLIPGGQQYQIYAPYFRNGTAPPPGFPGSTTPAAAPPWIAPGSSFAYSAGEMVFANAGAFADGTAQAADGQVSGTGATGQILLDIENTIVSAFNRGVANAVPPGSDVTAPWDNNATYYAPPNASGSNWSNFYAGFLHQPYISITAPGSNVGLAYGFAYDDQGGNDPTLTSPATAVAITLNSLVGQTLAANRTVFVVAPRVEIRLAQRAAVLTFNLKGALPNTTYTVILFQQTKAGDVVVGTPLTIRSNARGRIRASLKIRASSNLLVRLRPGRYRILVRDIQDTNLDVWSPWFRIRIGIRL